MKRLIVLSSIICCVLLIACGQSGDKSARDVDYTNSAAKLDSANKKKFINALASDTTASNYTDANGKQQGHWIYNNKVRRLPGYDSNAKVEEGSYKDGMKEGEWIEYNADGSIKSQTTYKDDKPVN